MTERVDAPADPLRRELLKLGLAGSLAVSTVGFAAGLAGCQRTPEAAAAGFKVLRDADLALLRALIPAILDGTLPAPGPERDARVTETLRRADESAQRIGVASQVALRKLFDLMNFGLTRRLLCGVAVPWAQADAAQVEAFLQRWRTSSVGLFNAGYRALVKLTCAAHFSIAASWNASGYPGPLAWVYDSVNR